MSSSAETGHAKNLANFQTLIEFVSGYGNTYNPSKETLKIPQLNLIATNAHAKLSDVTQKNTDYNNTVNDRILAFQNLRTLSTRLINALQATHASKETIKDAKGYNRKLQGKRALSATIIPDLNTPAPVKISTSQQSFDMQVQHFNGLISVLQSEISYKPNESELKITALTSKQSDLEAKNREVSVAYVNVSNSRIMRDRTLYDSEIGLVDVATEVKKYVKSVYGTRSPEFEMIKGIRFRKVL
ncbi:hypothetical protein NAT51_13755 [Flavobacterium amniphilum]|uniref:hypothetical protein n=1 Tax=Flavobacterium amniphilum TaxID=1834035 RepID=UPI00202A0639|nr:hypothetical protein [Flavobacterium amniphilum]MCL9806596.1 hypothetical protein [Flavobacterium amniphilum]